MAFFQANPSDPTFPIRAEGYVSFSGDFNSGFSVQSTSPYSENDTFQVVSYGADVLFGGGGNDTLLSSASGFAWDTLYGGDGADYIGLAANGNAHGEAGNDFIYGKGFAFDSFNFGAFTYTLHGGDGNDELLGTEGGRTITLNGGNGDDRLLISDTTFGADYRGAGTDTRYRPEIVSLFGGGGNDYLESEWASQMTGGIGVDVFHLSRSSVTTRHAITDFKDGVDKIAFNQTFGSLDIRQSGANTIIRDRNGMALAQLDNVQASQITLSDFVRQDTTYLHG